MSPTRRDCSDQRRPLAAKARTLEQRLLREFTTIVTLDTLLAAPDLTAKQYDGSTRRERLGGLLKYYHRAAA